MTAPLATGKGPRLEKETIWGATASYVTVAAPIVAVGAASVEM